MKLKITAEGLSIISAVVLVAAFSFLTSRQLHVPEAGESARVEAPPQGGEAKDMIEPAAPPAAEQAPAAQLPPVRSSEETSAAVEGQETADVKQEPVHGSAAGKGFSENAPVSAAPKRTALAPQEREVSKAVSRGDETAPTADGRVARAGTSRQAGAARSGTRSAQFNSAPAKKNALAGGLLARAGFPQGLNKAWGAIAPLAARIGPNGDINVLTKQAVPKVSAILPDDTIHEALPTDKEVLPAPPVRKPGDPEPVISDRIDSNHIIPTDLKSVALLYLNANKARFGNLKYMGLVDFSKHSSVPRFYIADLTRGTVKVFHVAHGTGSDSDNDGFATSFSNQYNSHASSVGFYMTGAILAAKHGRSLRLHGLSPTNSNAYGRAVILHPADYVSDRGNVRAGRSWGCLAVSNANNSTIVESLKGGALIYVWMSGVK